MIDQAHDEVVVRMPPPKVEDNKSAKGWLFILTMALGGAVAGYFGAKSMTVWLMPLDNWGMKLGAIVALPFTWLVVVGWHELGHLVGGWLGGGKFLLWVVGPLKVVRTPGGVKIMWNRSVNLGGGVAACVPTDPAKMTPRRTAIMILGGPMFSLLLVAICGWIMALIFAFADAAGGWAALVYNVVAFTMLISAFIFLVTMAPLVAGGFKSDGKRVLDLMKGDKRSEQEAVLLMLTTMSMGGVRPADYDDALVEQVLALNDGSMFDLYGRSCIYYHAADRAQWRRAQLLLDDMQKGEAQLVSYLRDVMRCEYAWLLATQTDGVAEARAWLDSAGKLDFDPATKLRAEAAVLWAEGDGAAALQKIDEGEHALVHKSLSPVRNVFAEEAFERLRAQILG